MQPPSIGVKPRQTSRFVYWDTRAYRSRTAVTLKQVKFVDARGKRHVYGRGDKFSGLPTLWMDIWLANDGTVFVRFHSRGTFVDRLTFEAVGWDLRGVALTDRMDRNERFVPAAVRDRYDDWVIERVEYPYE